MGLEEGEENENIVILLIFWYLIFVRWVRINWYIYIVLFYDSFYLVIFVLFLDPRSRIQMRISFFHFSSLSGAGVDLILLFLIILIKRNLSFPLVSRLCERAHFHHTWEFSSISLPFPTLCPFTKVPFELRGSLFYIR